MDSGLLGAALRLLKETVELRGLKYDTDLVPTHIDEQLYFFANLLNKKLKGLRAEDLELIRRHVSKPAMFDS
ncbi:hypothetical protein Pelo_11669 [Pelomyxa schiedti]|nr:hypothetical protein Pelo_11669 [Pelomyxa schiedti]